MDDSSADRADLPSENLSYKFQRLRERLRAAIDSGELAGKLPGERVLAKRFQVNAKTLSKALTDLAAEGVLDRCIGRGTYVRGSAPATTQEGRWLVLAEAGASSDLIDALKQFNPSLQVWTEAVESIRPSLINQFVAVIDLARHTPEMFLRDLVVRNLPVIAVGHEPKTYSMHTVVVDRQLGASRVTRQLMLAGHRKLAVVPVSSDTTFVDAVRQTAKRFDQEASADAVSIADLPAALRSGATAVICETTEAARQASEVLARDGADSSTTLVAVGTTEGGIPCSGNYVSTGQIANAVRDLLNSHQPGRPAVLWLAGEHIDRGPNAPTRVPNANDREYRTNSTQA